MPRATDYGSSSSTPPNPSAPVISGDDWYSDALLQDPNSWEKELKKLRRNSSFSMPHQAEFLRQQRELSQSWIKDFQAQQARVAAQTQDDVAGFIQARFGDVKTSYLSAEGVVIPLDPDERVAMAASQLMDYLSQVYGPAVAPMFQAALQGTPQQREVTMNTIERIAGLTPTTFGMGRGGATPQDVMPVEPSMENIILVMSDPSKIDTLPVGERNWLIQNMSQVAGDQGATDLLTGDIDKIWLEGVGRIATGNFETVDNLEEVVVDIRNASGEGQVVTLDKAWAQANPVEAASVMADLRERDPGVAFKIGEDGFVGKVMEYWDAAIDTISAPFGATLGSAFEAAGEAGEAGHTAFFGGVRGSELDTREAYKRAADQIQAELEAGNIPLDKQDDALRELVRNRDKSGFEMESWLDRLHDGLSPQEHGFGFADNLLSGSGILPGDPGYGVARAAAYLTAQIAFDPTNWIFPAIGASKAAKSVLVGVADASYKVATTGGDILKAAKTTLDNGSVLDAVTVALKGRKGLTLNGTLYETSELLTAGPAVAKRIEQSQGLTGTLATARHVILEVPDGARVGMENIPVQQFLDASKMEYLPVELGGGRKGVLIPNASTQDGLRLANELNLKEFHTTEGLAQLSGRKLQHVEEIVPAKPGDKGAVTLMTDDGPIAWSYKYAEETSKLPSTRIAGGTYKNMIWRARGTHVEDFADSEMAATAGSRLWEGRQLAPNEEVWLSRLNNSLGVGPDVGKLLWQATSEAEMRSLLGMALTGGTANLVPLAGARVMADASSEVAQAFRRAVRRTEDTALTYGDGMDPEEAARALAREKGIPVTGGLLDAERQASAMAAHYNDILAASDGITDPLSVMPSDLAGWEGARQWRRSYRDLTGISDDLANHPILNAYDAAAETVAKFPGNIMRGDTDSLRRFFNSKRGVEADEAARKFGSIELGRLGRALGRDTGAGQGLTFPHLAPFAETTAPSIADSAQHVRDFAGTWALPLQTRERLAGKFLAVNSNDDAYDFLTGADGLFETISRESPLLDAAGRQTVTKVFNTVLESSTPAKIFDDAPTAFHTLPTGSKQPVPVWSADKLQGFTLPRQEEVHALATATGRLHSRVSAAAELGGLGAKALSTTLKLPGYFAQLWKSAILLSKMPFSLISKIVSEELVRTAAYGEASVVNHPIEWFRSVTKSDKYALSANHPAQMLGVLEDDLLARQGYVNAGRKLFNSSDEGYDLALIHRLGAIHESPEFKFIIKNLDKDPAKLAAKVQQGATVRAGMQPWEAGLIETVAKSDQDLPGLISRMQAEVKSYIGGSDEVKKMLRRGKWQEKGKDALLLTEADTISYLRKLRASGDWNPTTASVSGQHLIRPGNRIDVGIATLRDAVFQKFYSGVDIQASRAPLYRTLRDKEYERLISLGWGEDIARAQSEYRAAASVRHLMFKVGGNTGAHYFLRNLLPFMPAWQEMATTWASRIPQALGGGHRALGYVRLAGLFDAVKESSITAGFVAQDPDGGYYITEAGQRAFGVAGALVGGAAFGPLGIIFGGSAALRTFLPGEQRIGVGSLAGIVPIPQTGPGDSESPAAFVGQFLPGLGGIHSAVLARMVEHNVFKDHGDTVGQLLLPYGTDVSIGGGWMSKALEAITGNVSPLEFLSHEGLNHRLNSALKDGLRAYMYENPPPKETDFKKPEAFEDALEKYVDKAEDEIRSNYRVAALTSALSSAFVPYNIYSIDDPEGERQLEQLQTFIEAFPGGEDAKAEGYFNIIKNDFTRAFPELAYEARVPDNISLRKQRNAEWGDWINSAELRATTEELSPREWIGFAAGMNSAAVHQIRLNALYDQAEGSVSRFLTNEPLREAIRTEQAAWTETLAFYEAADIPGMRKFSDLWQLRSEHLANLYGNEKYVKTLTYEQEQALRDIERLNQNEDMFRDNNGLLSDGYYEQKAALYDKVDSIVYAPPDTPFGRKLDKWFTYNDPYYQKRERLYDELEGLGSGEQGPIFEQLRKMADEYEPLVIDGERMPTPEETSWAGKNAREKRASLLDWAASSLEFRTQFQLEQLGIGTDDRTKEYLAYRRSRTDEFYDYTTKHDISSSSNDYDVLKAKMERDIATKGNELGVTALHDYTLQLPFQRVQNLVGNVQTPGWNKAVEFTMQLINAAKSHGVTPGGSSDAQGVDMPALQAQLMALIEMQRNIDPAFDQNLNLLGAVMTSDRDRPLNGPDLYMKLFLDYYDDRAPSYLYP